MISDKSLKRHKCDPPNGPDGQRQRIDQRIPRAGQTRVDDSEQEESRDGADDSRRRSAAEAQDGPRRKADEARRRVTRAERVAVRMLLQG